MLCRLVPSPHGVNRDGDNKQALIWGPIVLSRDENIDTDYDKAVDILSKDGIVDAEMETPTLKPTRLQFKVPTKRGFIHVVDYSSVNSWDGKKVCTWLPKSN
jgi:hypothetical protein